MKIYAVTTNSIFEQYAGKDIWIRGYSNDKYDRGDMFIRILYKSPSGIGYTVNFADAYHLLWRTHSNAKHRKYDVDYFQKCLHHVTSLDLDNCFTLNTPLDTFTTTEVLPDYSSDDRFAQFAGEDVWVKVSSPCESGWLDSYIKVISVDDPKMMFYEFPADLLGEYRDDGTHLDSTKEDCLRRLNRVYTGSIDEFELHDPLQLITTEDIMESLDRHYDNYRKHFGYMGEE